VEYNLSENKLEGTARLNDDKFGVAIFEISGSIIEGKMTIKGVSKQTAPGTVQGEVTIVADLKPDGNLVGRWETTVGTAGLIRLYPHSYEEKKEKLNEPEQIYNKMISVGSVRIFKKDIKTLFQIIQKDFVDGRLIVTYFQRESEVTRYAIDFLKNIDDLKRIRSLKIFIQEQEAPGINKMVNVDFFENSTNAIRVSGISESWVVGKAESISKQISEYENPVLTNYKKYGLNLNSFIFLIMLIFIPDIPTWLKRLISVSVVFVILLILYFIHSKLVPNTVIIAEDKSPSFLQRSWPSFASWVFAIIGAVIAGYLVWFFTK
jgi:hypothetical protein